MIDVVENLIYSFPFSNSECTIFLTNICHEFFFNFSIFLTKIDKLSIKDKQKAKIALAGKFLQLEFPTNQGIFFHDDVVQPLKPLLEEWLGIPLSEEDIAMFGIRFRRGAWMSLFADPYPIHAFGIILQVKNGVSFKMIKYLNLCRLSKRVVTSDNQILVFLNHDFI